MTEVMNPRDLFLHELGDILYVERKLADEVLPKLIDEVEDKEFKKGLEKHLRQTRGHVQNVTRVFKQLGEEAKAEKCIGFEGLTREHEELSGESSPDLVGSPGGGCCRPHRALRNRRVLRPPANGEGAWRGQGG